MNIEIKLSRQIREEVRKAGVRMLQKRKEGEKETVKEEKVRSEK